MTKDLLRPRASGVVGGLFAAALLVAIGNLSSLGRLLSNIPQDYTSFVDWTWDGSRAIRAGITEFPYFTALYADLHAHGVALPVTVLAIGLAYTVARFGTDRRRAADDRSRRRADERFGALLAVLALSIGALYPTNAWDLPVYAALGVVALVMAGSAIPNWRSRLVWIAGGSAILLGAAYLLYKPFSDHYVALFAAIGQVTSPTPFPEAATHVGGLAAIALLGLIVAVLPRRSALGWPLNQPVFVLGALSFLLLLANLAWRQESDHASALYALLLIDIGAIAGAAAWMATGRLRAELNRNAARIAVVAVLQLALGALISGKLVLGAYLILVALSFAIWTSGPGIPRRFTALLVMAGAAVGAGTEVIYVVDDLVGTAAYRMNTIFKFYNQIWILFAVSGGVLLATMVARAGWITRHRPAVLEAPGPTRQAWARGGTLIAAVLIGGSLLYPLLATGPRLAQRFPAPPAGPTLDGLAWMATGTLPWLGPNGGGELTFADDLAAIHWLNANIGGTPVIAEASIGPYRCNGSRFSIATGLPTIIGWERHEQQQRPPADLGPRVRDVETLYTAPDVATKRSIIDKYNVEYVMVGPLERYEIRPTAAGCEGTTETEGIAAFDQMVGSDLEVAFAQGETTIYRVLPPTVAGDGG